MRLVYSPCFLRDLDGIAAHLATKSPQGKRRVLAAIKGTVEGLEHFPGLGRQISDSGHRRLRAGRYPYVILYRVGGDEVFLLHVRHSARRPLDPEGDIDDWGRERTVFECLDRNGPRLPPQRRARVTEALGVPAG